jgi:hypothetical protein
MLPRTFTVDMCGWSEAMRVLDKSDQVLITLGSW